MAELIRFLTCGSVDDGKSTLIGRLLYDAGLVCEDHLSELVTVNGELDCSLLLDGLLAERAQGITIDVAYRHFATSRRRFIIADSPGHEEYTSNMVTAASHADLAVLLVDVSHGLQIQTRRHAAIVRLMGIDTVLLAVNKMDLVGYSEACFRDIEAQFRILSAELNIAQTLCIPVCARDGDNVVRRGERMPWYEGPCLLEWLEEVDPLLNQQDLPFRMAVQWVNRPNSTFRGVSGTIAAGRVSKGDELVLLDTGIKTHVASILGVDGEVAEARRGEAVTLSFMKEIDAGRGALLAAVGQPLPMRSGRVEADLVWLSTTPLQVGRSYLFKRGPVECSASVATVLSRLDLYSFQEVKTSGLTGNEQGRVDLDLVPPLFFESYKNNRELGHGILIDRVNGETVGALLLRHPAEDNRNVVWHDFSVTDASRARLKGQTPYVLWFTGLSGAGKSTIADIVERRLYALGRHTFVLDGDNVRHGLNRDLGFSIEDRVENLRRVAEVAKLMMEAGLIVLVTFISPLESMRRMARTLFPQGQFFEIFVDTPLSVCIERDVKGLYKRALAGEIKEMTGITSPYENPEHPDLVLDGRNKSAEELASEVLDMLEREHT